MVVYTCDTCSFPCRQRVGQRVVKRWPTGRWPTANGTLFAVGGFLGLGSQRFTSFQRNLARLSESKVFSELYKSHANEPGFFPYREALDILGIEIQRNRVILKKNDARKVALRQAIIYQH